MTPQKAHSTQVNAPPLIRTIMFAALLWLIALFATACSTPQERDRAAGSAIEFGGSVLSTLLIW